MRKVNNNHVEDIITVKNTFNENTQAPVEEPELEVEPNVPLITLLVVVIVGLIAAAGAAFVLMDAQGKTGLFLLIAMVAAASMIPSKGKGTGSGD